MFVVYKLEQSPSTGKTGGYPQKFGKLKKYPILEPARFVFLSRLLVIRD
jgi:hypothetical protein